MDTNVKLKIQGQITITSIQNKIETDVIKINNQIETSAIEIITKCLTGIDYHKSLDRVIATGPGILATAPITAVTYPSENEIILTYIFEEESFQGEITKLALGSTVLNKDFSTKEGLNINKDSNMRLKINWKIKIE